MKNVLEKVLEEIRDKCEELSKKHWGDDERHLIGKGMQTMYIQAEKIIRSHINHNSDDTEMDDWIPCSERLPEEEDSMFARFKGTDKWDNAMFEKKSDEVNITYELEDGTRKTGTSYTLDGKWKIEKENRIVKKKVVAWQSLPEGYKGE